MPTPDYTNLNSAGRTPLADVSTEVTRWSAFLGSLATSAAGYGILTAAQGDAVVGLLGIIPGVLTAVAMLWSAFAVVKRATPLVTPMSDPRADDGRPLVPAGSTAARRHRP